MSSFAKRRDGGKNGTRLRKECNLSTKECDFIDIEFHPGTSCIVIGQSVKVENMDVVNVRVTVGAKVTEGWLKESYLEYPEAYEVETVVKHKGKRGTKGRLYLIKWQGYPASVNSWEPRENLLSSEPFKAYACEHDDVTDVESDSGSDESDSESDSDSDSDSDGD